MAGTTGLEPAASAVTEKKFELVMGSRHGGWNQEESAAGRFLDAGAFVATNPTDDSITSGLPVIRPRSMRCAEITPYKPTSMIGLCQEGKSSPDALRRSACTKLFL